MPRGKVQQPRCPRLSQAIRTVYNRRKRGTPDADFYMMRMKHNIQAIGDLPVNQITEPLINVLIENPNVVVQLRSHTDNRAGDDFNMELSQRRAQICVDFMVAK